MKSIEYDLRYIQAAIEALDAYLLSEEVFWPIGATPPEGEPEYPLLTLDGILLAQARLSGRGMDQAQKMAVEQVISDLDMKRAKWRTAWTRKADRCYSARVRMWSDFIEEYQSNPRDNADRYPYEVRIRVMIQLLSSEISQENRGEAELITSLDGVLRSALKPSGFIWDGEIKPGFPADKYWYLYGRLPSENQGS